MCWDHWPNSGQWTVMERTVSHLSQMFKGLWAALFTCAMVTADGAARCSCFLVLSGRERRWGPAPHRQWLDLNGVKPTFVKSLRPEKKKKRPEDSSCSQHHILTSTPTFASKDLASLCLMNPFPWLVWSLLKIPFLFSNQSFGSSLIS